MKAQKKPVIIDYFPYNEDISDLCSWILSFNQEPKEHLHLEGEIGNLYVSIKTLEGISYVVTTDDVIIRGVKGEYYPCKKDIFEQTYNKID